MRAAAAAGALLALASLGGGGPAVAAVPRASVVPCGAVLTADVRLAADVVCPGGPGIVLAADGVELNLNGHRLVGPGLRFGPTGVEVAAEDVVVRNGRISGWGVGVSAGSEVDQPGEPRPVSGTVREVRLDGNRKGVEARVAGDLAVRGSRLDGNGWGGSAYVGSRLLVERSTVERNERGLHGFANADGGFAVRDSLVRSNGTGIGCDQDADVSVTGTTVQRNGTGLDVSQCSAVVEGSRFVWNARHVSAYLLEGDVLAVRCTSFTRDGGPVGVPLEPC
ncbi:hypothetical protein FHR75_003088 [Kineococcus radiotolerans]|uniref:Right handed beta helix domain-containing protein n=1 Tax=Kineococcus radiotolerans TaxID=131568 RepID=A0A7W4TNR4_KINRA|nr:right-handed parallel beta-helix repeat-containing protein [Kineococcus radiotolerans]MBB2902257.1 hypothetical protein [Kineococcus radiotolerans]